MEGIADISVLNTLTPSQLTGVLLNAHYENLVNLEQRSRPVFELLSSNQFWEEKLLNDYPDLQVTEEELLNPRNLYIGAEIDKLEKRVENIENNGPKDPRLQEIEERLEIIDQKVKKLNKEKVKLEEDKKNILLYYKQSQNSLQRKIERLKQELMMERMLP